MTLESRDEIGLVPFFAVAIALESRGIDFGLSYMIIRIRILWILSEKLCHCGRYFRLLRLLWLGRILRMLDDTGGSSR